MIRRHREPLPLGEPDGLPYSKGLMAKALIVTGVAPEPAYALARRIELDLAEQRTPTVDWERLEELGCEVLGAAEGEQAVRRLRRYRELSLLDVPLIVLIGGATGTGKSTVATEVAYRLGITRLTSTDFIRQTMRAFFSEQFMPSIHYSSFEAGAAVADSDTGDPALLGFIDQTRNVLTGVEAAIQRSVVEGWSMVLEGVHLVPGMVPLEIEGAVVIHVVLSVPTADAHRTHFHVRDITTGGLRAMQKYLARLDDIRKVQDYIVARAERTGTPVVVNHNPEQASADVMECVLAAAEQLQAVR